MSGHSKWHNIQQKKGKSDIWYFEKDGKFAGLVFTINSDDIILIDYLAIESVFDKCDNLKERLRRKEFYLKNGMTPMKVMVVLFGVEMELLGINCCLTYDEYYSFYIENYGDFAAKNIQKSVYPQTEQT